MTVPDSTAARERRYSNRELVRRLLLLAWQFRRDCLVSLVLSLILLLLGLLGLQLLGVVIDVIRHALDAAQRAPAYPFGWQPPETGARSESSRRYPWRLSRRPCCGPFSPTITTW